MKLIWLLYEYFILLIVFLLVLIFIKCFWKLIGLLSNYHNITNAYTCTYMKSSWFRAIFWHTRVRQTFMDPYGPWHGYAPYGHIFSLFSMFFLSYFFPKRHYHPLHHGQSYDRLSPSPQHHVWLHPPYVLLFTPYSPVICKDFFPLVYMYKLSRYYIVFHIDLGPMFPQSTSL